MLQCYQLLLHNIYDLPLTTRTLLNKKYNYDIEENHFYNNLTLVLEIC